jgi:hypothetical protein
LPLTKNQEIQKEICVAFVSFFHGWIELSNFSGAQLHTVGLRPASPFPRRAQTHVVQSCIGNDYAGEDGEQMSER